MSKVRWRWQGRRLTNRFFRLMQLLFEAYPDFYLEFDVGCHDRRWEVVFHVRGSIPWRDREYTFHSAPEEHLAVFLGRTVDTLRKRIDILRGKI